ncbi:hypothetical protein ACWY4P_40495 [Streptomyces sp. LZ34]
MTAPPDIAALKRLAALVTQRRVDLGMHKIDVAKTADITINTYNKIEAGQPVRVLTYAKIEPVLAWAPGTCRDILDGAASPTLVEKAPIPGVIFSSLPPDSFEDMTGAVQDAVIAVADQLTAAEIKEIARLAVEKYRQRRGDSSDSDTN